MQIPKLSGMRCARRASLPRLCILVVLLLGGIVLIDLVPRMVIVASEPRETAYWEAWEEAYVNRQVLSRQLQNITCSFAISVQR